ncbi:hypothetical protein MRB53_037018 [Persea americana]|nr:hypothetical protein MRB53_037018 [Persea americana]
MGWRCQIPVLLDLGLRVVCPDLMGFGGTDAPEALSLYSFKRASDDFAELARQLDAPKIIIGGHDWGGALVYRFALYHPELVTHVFAVCTAYSAPSKHYSSNEDIARRVPQFSYQIHLASGEIEERVKTKIDIRNFLNGLYAGRTKDKRYLLIPEKGVQLDVLDDMGSSPYLPEKVIDYYVEEYSRHGIHSTLNWYRTRRINYEDELALQSGQIKAPVLFIQALRDNVLTPDLSRGMGKYIKQLTTREVDSGHWALWQTTNATNKHIREWFEQVVFGAKSKI